MEDRSPTIGLICATMAEFEAMKSSLSAAGTEERPGGTVITTGFAGENEVALLKTPGTGKVAAAAAAQLAVERCRPAAVVSFGSAGALIDELEVGDIVIAETSCQGDVGIIAGADFEHTGSITETDGGIVGVLSYETDAGLLACARAASRYLPPVGDEVGVFVGPTVTCDQFIISTAVKRELNRRFSALAIDMEAAAVAQVAHAHGTPFMSIRSISDPVSLELTGITAAVRFDGESMPALWYRRAKLFAAHPSAVSDLAAFSKDIKVASRNAAAFTFDFIRRPGPTS